MEPYPDIKHYYYPQRYYEIGSARRQHQQHFLSVDEEVSECDQAHEKEWMKQQMKGKENSPDFWKAGTAQIPTEFIQRRGNISRSEIQILFI